MQVADRQSNSIKNHIYFFKLSNKRIIKRNISLQTTFLFIWLVLCQLKQLSTGVVDNCQITVK